MSNLDLYNPEKFFNYVESTGDDEEFNDELRQYLEEAYGSNNEETYENGNLELLEAHQENQKIIKLGKFYFIDEISLSKKT